VPGYTDYGFDGRYVWGRGAVDAKGAFASMVTSLIIASSRGGVECGVRVVSLAREEGDSGGAWGLVKRLGVTPFVIVGEPTGAVRVAVGYKGSLKASVVCEGGQGHSANHPLHGSAADRLIDALITIRARLASLKLDPIVTMINSGVSHNVVAPEAKAVIDVRLHEGLDPLRVASLLCDTAMHYECLCAEIEGVSPVKVSVSAPVPRALLRALRGLGLKPGVSLKRGTSDMNILFHWSISIAAYGPGDPMLSHTPYERVSVEELGIAAMAYYEAFKTLCERGAEWMRI
jgi:LysW-gamma-L-lysine carboxypeptidase